MVFLGVMVYAFDTLLINLSGASGPVAGFWRGFFAFLCVSIVFPIAYRGRVSATLGSGGLPMLLSGVLYGIGGIVYSNSVSLIGTSMSLILLSLTPIITSLFSIVLLKEHPRKITWLTMVVCFITVSIMFGSSAADLYIPGLFLGLVTPIALSLNFVNLRAHPAIPRLGVTMTGGLFAAIACSAMSGFDLALPFDRLRYLLVLGMVVIPVGQFMITSGTKFISASETTLINSLECIIGMFYVFIFTSVAPSRTELVGALVILSAIAVNVVSGNHTHAKKLHHRIRHPHMA